MNWFEDAWYNSLPYGLGIVPKVYEWITDKISGTHEQIDGSIIDTKTGNVIARPISLEDAKTGQTVTQPKKTVITTRFLILAGLIVMTFFGIIKLITTLGIKLPERQNRR
jgi:hypothetical protein